MEKWGFGLSKKEVLKKIGRCVNENKIHKPRRGVPGDGFFTHGPLSFQMI